MQLIEVEDGRGSRASCCIMISHFLLFVATLVIQYILVI